MMVGVIAVHQVDSESTPATNTNTNTNIQLMTHISTFIRHTGVPVWIEISQFQFLKVNRLSFVYIV